MSGRRRATTEDERELFYQTFADVKPLKPQTKPAARKKPSPAAPKAAKAKAPTKPAPKPAPHVRDEPPEIGGHRARGVKRGRAEPEARLDLHGMTQDAAHRALTRFFQRGRAMGARMVLVITGKSGVLHRQFKPWLAQGEFAALVAGVSPAHARHGGGGAFYVLLKKPPAPRT